MLVELLVFKLRDNALLIWLYLSNFHLSTSCPITRFHFPVPRLSQRLSFSLHVSHSQNYYRKALLDKNFVALFYKLLNYYWLFNKFNFLEEFVRPLSLIFATEILKIHRKKPITVI